MIERNLIPFARTNKHRITLFAGTFCYLALQLPFLFSSHHYIIGERAGLRSRNAFVELSGNFSQEKG